MPGWSFAMRHDEPAWTSQTLAEPHDAPDKSVRVRRMFNGIARRYELINTLFSAGRDAAWRREAVRLAQVSPVDDVLDIAAGTGDFSRAFAAAGARSVVGVDFAHEMLKRAASAKNQAATCWCEADAMCLPFANESCSVVSSAFGVRNFADLDVGLREMYRVLRPSGRAVILEFTTPTNRVTRAAYHLYSQRIMPLLASLISGDREGAYRYLPRSVVSFPTDEQVCRRLDDAGFVDVSATPLTMRIVTVYVARRDK